MRLCWVSRNARHFFRKTRTEITGTPVRTELVRLDRADSRRKLGLREDLPTLLVMGGSQGASGINQALIKALPFLQGVPLQVIHLSGARDERLVAGQLSPGKCPCLHRCVSSSDGGSVQRR
jgi:UDP-N-acetylglucosamine--N-acetylmuramyl-(pentapeptide) pyrophosphoryl-undecaprenol N-acetylglucosamine transferase